MLKPTYNHKHADTIEGLRDNVCNENTTSNCHHCPSESPDLCFHSEDLLRDLRSITIVPSTRELTLQKVSILSAPAEICRAGLLPDAK
jgi:hypothetical protein